MANPSLQIGNSNWAIKEDDLLGYSTVGTNYLPKPMTMTRASLGTRVNSNGLVEDVELLGGEKVTNGNFATDLSGWSNKSSTSTWVSGSARIDNSIGNNNSGLFQDIGLILDKTYTLTATLKLISADSDGNFVVLTSNSIGSGQTIIYTGNALVIGGASVTETIEFTTSDSDVSIQFACNATNAVFEIDNVSVKEATIDNLPRVDYTDGTSSLLVEPQRTNLIEYSEDFSQSYWTETDASVSLSTTTSPDGLATSYKLIPDNGTGGNRSIGKSFIGLSNNHTHTCFAKKGEYNYLMLRMRNSPNVGVMFDLENGTLNLNNPGAPYVDSEIESIGNGWYKCSITLDPSQSGTSGQLFISMSVGITGSETNSFSGDGTSGIYIWGCGLEEGSYPTSYIPNFGTSAGVTRVQETYEKTGISNLINSEEGVLFVEIAALSESNLNSYITIGQNTSNGILGISFYTGSNNILLDHWEGASETYHIESISDVTEFNKIAICYDGTSIKGYINGSPVWNTTVTAWSSNALSELNFAFGNSGTNKFLGKVKQLQVFKTALSDSELAALTS